MFWSHHIKGVLSYWESNHLENTPLLLYPITRKSLKKNKIFLFYIYLHLFPESFNLVFSTGKTEHLECFCFLGEHLSSRSNVPNSLRGPLQDAIESASRELLWCRGSVTTPLQSLWLCHSGKDTSSSRDILFLFGKVEGGWVTSGPFCTGSPWLKDPTQSLWLLRWQWMLW